MLSAAGPSDLHGQRLVPRWRGHSLLKARIETLAGGDDERWGKTVSHVRGQGGLAERRLLEAPRS